VIGSSSRLIVVSTDQVPGDPGGLSSYFVESLAIDGTAASEMLLGSYPASHIAATPLRGDGWAILVGAVRHGLDSSRLFTSPDGQAWIASESVKDPLLVGPMVDSGDGLIAGSVAAGQDPTTANELAWLPDGTTTWKRVEIAPPESGSDRIGWALPRLPVDRPPLTLATVLSTSAGMILTVSRYEHGRVTDVGSVAHDVPDIGAVSVLGDKVISISASRLLRSTDGGQSFDVEQVSLDGVPVNAEFIDASRAWIEAQTEGQRESLELTSDGGQSWTTIAAMR
jgi:hypothetical protein